MHKQRAPDSRRPEVEQHRRCLFWSTYIFERKTALVLGRPFALSDDEIELDMPLDAHDDYRKERPQCDNPPNTASDQQLHRTTLSFHRHHIQLYQIHTHIRLTLHHMRKASSGELYETMTGLFEKLDDWKKQVLATFNIDRQESGEQTHQILHGSGDQGGIDSGYLLRPVEVERTELLLEFHKARRSLLQPLMIEGRHQYPFDVDDYAACADASGQICQLYRKLHRLSPIPFTLRDLHAVFVAGFTLIYCVCTCPNIYSADRVSDVGACSTVLYVITEQWASAKKYRDAFEIVAEKMMDSAKRYRKETDVVLLASKPTSTSQDELSFSAETTTQQRASPVQLGPASTEPRPVVQTSYPPYDCTYIPAQNDRYGEDSSNSSGALFGIELDLDSDIYDIEGLLSTEGLDWFTGAVI